MRASGPALGTLGTLGIFTSQPVQPSPQGGHGGAGRRWQVVLRGCLVRDHAVSAFHAIAQAPPFLPFPLPRALLHIQELHTLYGE